LLKLAFEGGSALAQRKLRLTDHVTAASIYDVTADEIMEAPCPSRIWITVHEELAPARHGRAWSLIARSLAGILVASHFNRAPARAGFAYLRRHEWGHRLCLFRKFPQ
jgi:hypothetical protein